MLQSDHFAISLIHPSQESQDVEDRLGDLVLWLTKLKDGVVTTSVDGNREEAERREQLTMFAITFLLLCPLNPTVRARTLERIEKKSRMLLNKGKGAKLLDKKQDSGMAVKLVEELRQAILFYQVGTFENHG